MTERGPGRLLVTGVPGWFGDSFLRSLAVDPLPGITSVRCLVKQEDPISQRDLQNRYGLDVEVVRGNLLDATSLERAVDAVDTILHAAAVMHVRRISDYYTVNAEGTRSLARAATSAGVRRFVYLSTNAAAGKSDAPERTILETDPDKPLSHYGRSKWLAERWVLAAPAPMEGVVIRSCMFYGPPVPERHVDVYRRILSRRMPLVGSGQYARSLTHIDNLVQGARLAISKDAAKGQVYNIADAEPYTTRRVVEAMASALGVTPRYLRLPALAADVAYATDWLLGTLDRYQQEIHLVSEATWNVGVSIGKAQRELGYSPRVAIEEGMRGAVQWCREQAFL